MDNPETPIRDLPQEAELELRGRLVTLERRQQLLGESVGYLIVTVAILLFIVWRGAGK